MHKSILSRSVCAPLRVAPLLSKCRIGTNVFASHSVFTFGRPEATISSYLHLPFHPSSPFCRSPPVNFHFQPSPLSVSLNCFFSLFFFFFHLHCFPLPQKNEGDLFHRLWHVMNEILDLRRQVLVGHLTHDRMRDVKQHITARLDWGNE